ncbi:MULTISPECIES: ATP-binding protein [unclassified Leptolyngbya]|uniref:ATP-binding protein n=1 Tax=unclassified Leptolyngbya TaxID=2650499 RepID=UPI001685F164|nr:MULTISPECIES: ATP-binding protein [unclassified Leptolyngbya]MBD1913233.1 response regulator [Leptolyngbya sp. FACHB-8]MBD2153377.1 response regulator [Leptolyngbya sp. FACHB-16]
MQRPKSETVTLKDILITEELAQRPPRSPNLQAENQAMRSLAQQMARDSQSLMQTLADTALELCQAGTAGVSLLETTADGEKCFRWNVLAGTLAHHAGSTTPHHFSPCGVCLDQGTPVLFSHPGSYFTYFQAANTLIVEGLVLPLMADHHALGTIWIMSHDEQRHFDAEDVRIMTSLADFTATALLLNQRQTRELLAVNAALEAKVEEHRHAEAQLRALISNLPGGATFVLDRDLRYLLAEGEALAIAGFKPEDFVGRTIFEVLPSDLAAKYEPLYRQAFAGEPFEHEHQAHDRTYISRGTPLYSPEGEVYAVLAVSYDISDRIYAEAALRQSEEKYRSLFNSMDEAYAVVEVLADDNGEWNDFLFLEVNPAFVKQTGMEYPVGRKATELLGTPNLNWAKIYGRVAETGEPIRVEEGEATLGRVFDLYVFRLGGDGSRRVAVLFTDITDRKKAEAALQESEERQAYLLRLSDALRPLSDPIKIQWQALNIVGEYLDLDRVLYSEIDPDVTTYTVYVNYVREGFPSYTGSYPIRLFAESVKNLRLGKTSVIYDVENEEQFNEEERAICRGINVQAFVVVPLIKQGQWVVNVVAHYSKARNWTQYDVSILEETAERTWAAVERARAEAALRELEVQRIREQSALEQERQRAESLAELDRAKTLFFTNISHEFRTPLTLSLAPLQDVLSDLEEKSANADRNHPLDPIHRERLELIHRNSLRLLKLVNTLLDFSRIEAGRMAAAYEPTDLALFTTELASVFRSAIERAGLQLIVDCPPLPEPVYIDREMWEKIVLNLLSNAFKFTFTGEIRVSLHATDGNQALLQIKDTGTGIAPEHLPHLFERFYQIRGTQARTHEGSGIGLTLVHELVRLQGGTIEVSSTVGEGTCFAIALPFGTEHLPSDRLQLEGDRQPTRTLASTAVRATSYMEEAERWLPAQKNWEQTIENTEEQTVQTANFSSCPTVASAHVLLVDDNADMREYLTRILSEHFQVKAAADGATALTVAQEQVPDLILSDVMIPGLNGFELLEALRADLRTREVPIILLSARAGEEAIAEGLEAGADDYLIKPFSAQELISRVTAHLQMAQLRGEALRQERTINRQKDEFISVVSHELNTPLVSILGWTRMLRSNPPSPVMLNKALDTIERNATLQSKLVQDLLDLSRITAGKFRLNLQPIELQPVIEAAIATVTQTAANKGINLTWQENAAEPLVVMGDGDRLGQVICNLLTNAIKFTPESGSVTLELSVIHDDRASDTSYAEIRVTDTGIGIVTDFLPYVFDRFSQAERAHSAKGLGLGLAIARHIVELHNGLIRVESSGEGQGATFIVRLLLVQQVKCSLPPESKF